MKGGFTRINYNETTNEIAKDNCRRLYEDIMQNSKDLINNIQSCERNNVNCKEGIIKDLHLLNNDIIKYQKDINCNLELNNQNRTRNKILKKLLRHLLDEIHLYFIV